MTEQNQVARMGPGPPGQPPPKVATDNGGTPALPAEVTTAVRGLLAPYGLDFDRMMKRNAEPSELSDPAWTVREFADHFGLSQRHVRRLISRGDLPILRLGPRSVRLTSEAIREYTNERTEWLGNDMKTQRQQAPLNDKGTSS